MGLLTAVLDRASEPALVVVTQDAGHGHNVSSVMRGVHQDMRWDGKQQAWIFPFLPAAVYALSEAADMLRLQLRLDATLDQVRKQVSEENIKEAEIRKLVQRYIDDKTLSVAEYTGHPVLKPFPHQAIAYHWAMKVRVLYLMHKMGLGKTREGADIVRGDYERQHIITPEQFYCGRTPSTINPEVMLPEQWCVQGGALVVCPAAVISEWTEQLWKWQGIEALSITGDAEQKRHKAGCQALVHVCSYDSLEVIERNIYWRIIADEAHYVANQDSNRFRRLMALRRKAKRALALSGTAQSHGLESLFSQFYFLDGGRTLGPTMGAFKKRFLAKKDREDNLTPEEAVSRAISRVAWPLSMQEAFPDKAHKIHKEIRVPMTEEQAVFYEKVRTEAETNILSGKLSLTDSMTRLSKLLQITQGFVLDNARIVQQFSSAKLNALEELIKKGGDLDGKRSIIWCGYVAEKEMICALLKRMGKKYLVLDGNVKDSKREALKDAWNTDASYTYLVGMIQMGIGLNLHAPDCVDEQGQPARVSTTIFYNMSWKMTLIEQAMDRVYRSDQKETCLYIYLLSEDIYEGKGRKKVEPIDVRVHRTFISNLENAKKVTDGTIEYIRGLIAA
jgi:SNF2 family DNA or RNA helicase